MKKTLAVLSLAGMAFAACSEMSTAPIAGPDTGPNLAIGLLDGRPDVTPRRISGNTTCSAQIPGAWEYKLDRPGNTPNFYNGTFVSGGLTLQLSGDNKYVTFISNQLIAGVVVKGSTDSNFYDYRGLSDGGIMQDDRLQSPASGGKVPDISHVSFCFFPRLAVTKTANTTFDRDFNWTLQKSANPTGLTLEEDDQATVNYTLTVGNTPVDSNWAVSGTITIRNPWSQAATISSITDIIAQGAVSTNASASVSCPAMTVPARSEGVDGQLECTYSSSLPNGNAGTNTATVNPAAPFASSSGATPVTFGAPTNVTDASVDLNDVLTCPAGFSCTPDGQPSNQTISVTGPIHYTVLVVNTSATCEQGFTLDNTATLTETTGGPRVASAQVLIYTGDCDIPPPPGGFCTRTQGYWKTHSSYGPVPAHKQDGRWMTVGGPNATFFLSGQSWIQVFWTAPQGNAYYILAHQYMAAKLNVLGGAPHNQAVLDDLAAAEAFFTVYTPATGGALNGADRQNLIDLAGRLDAYNNSRQCGTGS